MITPGLLRRSFVRAFQWRPIALQLFLLALAGFVAAHPWLTQFSALFGQLPDQKALTAHLGSAGLAELVLRLNAPGSLHPETASVVGLALAVLASVIFAGAILAVAASDELLHSRELLEGAGRYYGRLFRLLFFELFPFAVCIGVAALAFHWSGKVGERAITEHEANRAVRVALAVALLCYVLAGVWTDLARAFFVAQPARRSAFFAVCAGTWLLLRRPLRAICVGVVFDLLAFVLAALFMIARQQITQSGWRILLALLLSQCALALLAWGRVARLLGLVELARADVLARKKPAGTFEMAPPKTSPPPVQEIAILTEPEPILPLVVLASIEEPAPQVLAEPAAAPSEIVDPSMVGTPTIAAPIAAEPQPSADPAPGQGSGEGAQGT